MFRKMFAIFTLLFGILAAAPAAWAIAEENELALHPFLSYTAMGQGMGNAVASIPGTPSNVWINPAGLSWQKGYLLYVAPNDEVNDFQDARRDRVFMASAKLSKNNTVGAAVILRDGGDRQFQFVDGDELTLIRTDILEKVLLLSYARQIGSNWSAGVTGISYQHSADHDSLDGEATFAATFGVLFKQGHTLGDLPVISRVGVSVANLGPTFMIGNRESDLPLYARFGYSSRYEKDRNNTITLAADIYNLLRDRTVDLGGDENTTTIDRLGWSVGTEIRVSGVVAIRLGYQSDDDILLGGREGGTFGFGIGHEIFRGIGGMFEYGRSPAPTANDSADHFGVRLYYVPGLGLSQ